MNKKHYFLNLFPNLLNCLSVQANPGWSSQSSDSEDDHMKQRNVSSDEEDLQKAVQDLGLVVLGTDL